jgi:tetratricopeptide (TPR) repeat protein
MKELLQKYQNNVLNAADTEGVEKRLVKQAVEREMRQKWGNLLAENGIERTLEPVVAETDAAKDPVFMAFKKTQQRRFIMGIAASLLLVAGFWWWSAAGTTAVDLTNTALFDERFAAPSVRMGQNDDLKNWADAKDAYRDGQFDKAAKLIETLPTPNIEQQFYGALSHIYATQPNYEKAAASFKAITENPSGSFKAESWWYYALSNIKLGRPEEAKKGLEYIVKQNGWKAKQAQELLNKLN